MHAGLAGGTPAEEQYRALFPHAAVQRMHGTSHVTIPFSVDTGQSVVLFAASIVGAPLRHSAL